MTGIAIAISYHCIDFNFKMLNVLNSILKMYVIWSNHYAKMEFLDMQFGRMNLQSAILRFGC